MSKPHFNDANIDIYSETTKLFNIFLLSAGVRDNKKVATLACRHFLFSIQLPSLREGLGVGFT